MNINYNVLTFNSKVDVKPALSSSLFSKESLIATESKYLYSSYYFY